VTRLGYYSPGATQPNFPATLPSSLLAQLRGIPGVRAITLARSDQSQFPGGGFDEGVVTCADLARTPALGRCPAGARVVRLGDRFNSLTSASRTVWPPVAITLDRFRKLPVQTIAVDATGSPAAVERARTIIELAYPLRYLPLTVAEDNAMSGKVTRTRQYSQLVDVVIVASLPIAGCSLAVSVAAGLADRRRPFSLLRLSGAPLAMLRRVVGLEGAVPLIGIAALSILVGFGTAGMFVRSQLSETLQAPPASYYPLTAAGLLAALLIIASTLPLLSRVTGPEAARND
jgi:hypothetical protein